MKFKAVVLGMFLCCFSVFAAFSFAGCGDVTISMLKESFENLDSTFSNHAEYFSKLERKNGCFIYVVSGYGETVDGFIQEGKEEYAELVSLYNSSLEIASDYVASNREYVLGLGNEMDKKAKDALKALNESVQRFSGSINAFVKAHQKLTEHFSVLEFQNEKSNEAALLSFKKEYGQMVKNCVNLSCDMARMVEATEIFQLLKDTTPTVSDTQIIKEYISAKILPIFTEMRITEIANNMNWNGQKQGDCKERINSLIASADEFFENFKTNFLLKDVKNEALSIGALNDAFDFAEDFSVETEAYFQALYGLNLKALAVDFDNIMENYLKANELAEVYLQKLEQFVEVALDNFIQAISAIIF